MEKGWEYKKLKEIARITSGQGAPQGEDNYCDNGTPFIKAGNMESLVNGAPEESVQKVSNEVANNYKLKKYAAGSVLFAKSGMSCMKGWVYTLKNDCYVVSHLAILTPLHIIPNFLNYYLRYIKTYSLVQDAAYPTISLKDIENLLVPTPPLEEQRSIVAILDAAFTKIDALRNNAEKQLAEARALFYRALSEKLLPKEGWNKYTIADICKSATYGTSSPSNDNGRYKYLRMNNINTDGSLNLNNLKTIDIPDKELEKYLVRKGDLLFNRTNSPELVGKSCVFDREEEMIIAGYIIRIRFKDGFDPYFVCYFINLQRQIGNLKPLIVGAVHQANISATAIKSLEIHCPPLAEQKLIVSQLDVLSVNVRKMEDILHKTQTECDALKQAMLKEVFE